MASHSLAAAASRSTAGGGCGAVCGVLRDPVLRALAGASRTTSLGTAPGLEIKRRKLSRIEKFTKYVTKNGIQNTYPDRALMLHFLVALLRARGIELSLEDCPEGAPLVSARWLGAASMDDSSPAAASAPRINTWGAGVSSAAADGDDSRAAASREGFADGPPAALGSSGATVAPSSSSHR